MLTDKGVIKAGAGATVMCQGSEAEIPEQGTIRTDEGAIATSNKQRTIKAGQEFQCRLIL